MENLKELIASGKATVGAYEEAIVRLYGSVLECNKQKATLRHWKRLREEQSRD